MLYTSLCVFAGIAWGEESIIKSHVPVVSAESEKKPSKLKPLIEKKVVQKKTTEKIKKNKKIEKSNKTVEQIAKFSSKKTKKKKSKLDRLKHMLHHIHDDITGTNVLSKIHDYCPANVGQDPVIGLVISQATTQNTVCIQLFTSTIPKASALFESWVRTFPHTGLTQSLAHIYILFHPHGNLNQPYPQDTKFVPNGKGSVFFPCSDDTCEYTNGGIAINTQGLVAQPKGKHYAVFGQVIKGIDNLDIFAKLKTINAVDRLYTPIQPIQGNFYVPK
jgi:hypothetical protein